MGLFSIIGIRWRREMLQRYRCGGLWGYIYCAPKIYFYKDVVVAEALLRGCFRTLQSPTILRMQHTIERNSVLPDTMDRYPH
jgi:hypothetical protein